jgi:hypothetical protein
MIEVRALPQLEVADWSEIVRVPLARARGTRSPTVVIAVLSTMTAIFAALLLF